MRKVHQKADGFEPGKSKTFYLPVERLYGAWIVPEQHARWLETQEEDLLGGVAYRPGGPVEMI